MMVIATIIVILFFLSMLFIFLFSLVQLHLSWIYLKHAGKPREEPEILTEFPFVTVQLPVYNEKYVIKRLLLAVTAFDYPMEMLEFQILDDSTDDTVSILEQEVAEYRKKGFDIKQIRRSDRKGFKAGALASGLQTAKGEFLVIFDADFIPEEDFLKRTLPYFQNPKVGVVQTRWGHLNRDYSLLTKLQAFGLDAHFSIEQVGRGIAGSFINFNGTGGVWRKTCILDAGGWSADTLTEDLDLSYRAQLKGWKFIYTESYEAPAELPVIMPAIKSQQQRWNKGAAETARKHIVEVFRKKWPLKNKIHAFFHLFNSSIFIFLLADALLSVPMLFIKGFYPIFNTAFYLGSVFLIGFFSIALFYWIASRQMFPKDTFRYYITLFPPFLIMSMGLSLHNAIAVFQGLMRKKSAFIRTPKFNIINTKDPWQGNDYVKSKLGFTTILEGLLAFYFVFGVISGIILGDWALMIFHIMLALGFALVFIYSLKAQQNA